MSQSAKPFLRMRGITKRFPGTVALDRVDFDLAPAEVAALIGENGAGKSTLMKVLAGIHAPDEGEILLDGAPRTFRGALDAIEAGIALIHQELALADNLTVAENIFLGHEPRKGRLPLFDRRAALDGSRAILERIGLDVHPFTPLRRLPPGQRQLVEVAKALSLNARILVMDEPTSSLSRREAKRLFEVIRSLRDEGVGIVYISHRLGEVREVADRVEVLKDGRCAGSLTREEAAHDRMVQCMVGRDISRYYRADHAPGEEPLLEIKGLLLQGGTKKIDLTLRRGEILCLAGLVGAGRTELVRALFGIDPVLEGEILLDGRRLILKNPMDAIRAGIGLVPEDRQAQGLVLEMAVGANLSLTRLMHLQRFGFWSASLERREVDALIQRLSIRTPSARMPAQYLSGGNQQKTVLGKWLAVRPRVLILDEPTRGVDVGAKEEIYALMCDLTREGVSILMVSSEMEEVLGMSDRVAVMHEGRLSGEIERGQLTEEAIMSLATGREPS